MICENCTVNRTIERKCPICGAAYCRGCFEELTVCVLCSERMKSEDEPEDDDEIPW